MVAVLPFVWARYPSGANACRTAAAISPGSAVFEM